MSVDQRADIFDLKFEPTAMDEEPRPDREYRRVALFAS